MGDLINKLIKKSAVDRYKIGIQTVSQRDGLVELPAGAIPLAVNMRMSVLTKNPQTNTFDMGSIDVVVYAQKIKDENIEIKKIKNKGV
jgi:hypothetical protein